MKLIRDIGIDLGTANVLCYEEGRKRTVELVLAPCLLKAIISTRELLTEKARCYSFNEVNDLFIFFCHNILTLIFCLY